MPGRSNQPEYHNGFVDVFQQMEDEQLLEVLEKRNLYQPEAAEAAVQEAVSRGLIASADELPAPLIKEKHLRLKLFPVIEHPKTRIRIRKSVARMLFLAGLLPAIWGIVRFNSGFSTEGVVLVVYALLWMGSAAWLIRTYKYPAIVFLVVLAILSLVYIVRLLLFYPGFIFMDFFIISVLYLLMIYGLVFIIRLAD